MANAMFLQSANNLGGISASATRYTPIGNSPGTSDTTENTAQVTWRTPGSFSNLYAYIEANATTATSQIAYRVGGANQNESLIIPIGTTGDFTDTTHTDAVTAGQQVNHRIDCGAGGTMVFATIGIQFSSNATTDVVNKLTAFGSFTDTSVNTTYYFPIAGGISAPGTTEANMQFKNKNTATLQNLYAYISANTASVATITSRIGGGAGNLSISIASGVTGVLEDTTHTDSISSGSLINYAFQSTVTTSLTINHIAVDYVTSSTGLSHFIAGFDSDIVINAGNTNYFAIAGNGSSPTGSTETDARAVVGIAYTASNLETYVDSNNVSAGGSLKFRKNNANGNQVITIGTSATGYMEDSTHTDSIGNTDTVDYQGIASSGGKTSRIRMGTQGHVFSIPAVTAATGDPLWFGMTA